MSEESAKRSLSTDWSLSRFIKTMDIGALLTTGGFFLFIGVLAVIMLWEYRRASYSYNLKIIPGFQSTRFLLGHDTATALAIDDGTQQICIMVKRRGKPNTRVIPYKELLSVEIIEDGKAVMRSSRSSQVGGALIGGLLTMPLGLGVVGALVGGLTGKKVSDDIVKRLDLVLILNDLDQPRFTVNFLNEKAKKSSKSYKAAIEQARHWHSVFGAVIKRAESSGMAITSQRLNAAPSLQLPVSSLESAPPKPTSPPRPPLRFFLYLNNEVKGPYLPTEIRVLCDVGTANDSTPLCREGEEAWGTVSGLLG